MGNFSEKVYIVGERDYRLVAFDRPVLYETNLGLRYSSIYNNRPDFAVDYNQEFNMKWLYVNNPELLKTDTCLRSQNQTMIVLVEAERSTITGNLSNCTILETAIVPIVKPYPLK